LYTVNEDMQIAIEAERRLGGHELLEQEGLARRALNGVNLYAFYSQSEHRSGGERWLALP
jgi:hypothetical protein